MKVYLRGKVQAARYRTSTTLSGTDLVKHLRKFTSITAGCKIKTTPWSMWYYLWTGAPALESDDRATYNFLIAGHAKFVPDWCFGLVEQRTRKTSISSLFDIARAVDRGFRDSEHGWVAWIAQWYSTDLNVRLDELPRYIFQEDSASENLSSRFIITIS